MSINVDTDAALAEKRVVASRAHRGHQTSCRPQGHIVLSSGPDDLSEGKLHCNILANLAHISFPHAAKLFFRLPCT